MNIPFLLFVFFLGSQTPECIVIGCLMLTFPPWVRDVDDNHQKPHPNITVNRSQRAMSDLAHWFRCELVHDL